MSNTYRDKYRAITNQAWNTHYYDCKSKGYGWWYNISNEYNFKDDWNRTRKIPERHRKNLYHYPWYANCPRWWNKEHHIKPLRRANKRLCRAFLEQSGVEEGIAYPLYGKPHWYYW